LEASNSALTLSTIDLATFRKRAISMAQDYGVQQLQRVASFPALAVCLVCSEKIEYHQLIHIVLQLHIHMSSNSLRTLYFAPDFKSYQYFFPLLW
jgi:hypothetical protein